MNCLVCFFEFNLFENGCFVVFFCSILYENGFSLFFYLFFVNVIGFCCLSMVSWVLVMNLLFVFVLLFGVEVVSVVLVSGSMMSG